MCVFVYPQLLKDVLYFFIQIISRPSGGVSPPGFHTSRCFYHLMPASRLAASSDRRSEAAGQRLGVSGL